MENGDVGVVGALGEFEGAETQGGKAFVGKLAETC